MKTSVTRWIVSVITLALLSACGGPTVPSGDPTRAEPAAAAPAQVTQPAKPPASSAPAPVRTAPQEIAPALEGTHTIEKDGPVTATEPPGAGGAGRVARDPVPAVDDGSLPEPFQTWCMFAGTGATMGIDGERLNFTCSQAGEMTVGLFGDVKIEGFNWMIARKSFRRGADGFEGLDSEMVRVEAILLHDGMRCQAAGEAGVDLGDRRAYFTCPGADGRQYVLLGEVSLGDEGWQIERAVLTRLADGFRLEGREQALIDGLGVRKSGDV